MEPLDQRVLTVTAIRRPFQRVSCIQVTMWFQQGKREKEDIFLLLTYSLQSSVMGWTSCRHVGSHNRKSWHQQNNVTYAAWCPLTWIAHSLPSIITGFLTACRPANGHRTSDGVFFFFFFGRRGRIFQASQHKWTHISLKWAGQEARTGPSRHPPGTRRWCHFLSSVFMMNATCQSVTRHTLEDRHKKTGVIQSALSGERGAAICS